MNSRAWGRMRRQNWCGSALTIQAQCESFGFCTLLAPGFLIYHVSINFRTHDENPFAGTTHAITYTLITGGGGEVLGVETGGGGDLQRMVKVVTTKMQHCHRLILSL